MSSSGFPYNYNQDNFIYILNNIDAITNYKGSKCDILPMYYTSKPPITCSKVLLKCVINCTNFTEKECNGYIFETNCSSLGQKKNLVFFLTKKEEETFHITNLRPLILIVIKTIEDCP